MSKQKKKSIGVALELEPTDKLHMAVELSSGSAGKKVKREWSMSSEGTDLIVTVGNSTYRADLMPLLRKVLGAEGVR